MDYNRAKKLWPSIKRASICYSARPYTVECNILMPLGERRPTPGFLRHVAALSSGLINGVLGDLFLGKEWSSSLCPSPRLRTGAKVQQKSSNICCLWDSNNHVWHTGPLVSKAKILKPAAKICIFDGVQSTAVNVQGKVCNIGLTSLILPYWCSESRYPSYLSIQVHLIDILQSSSWGIDLIKTCSIYHSIPAKGMEQELEILLWS